jgi:hypothetical protein
MSKDFRTNGYKFTLGYMFEDLPYINIGVENSIAYAKGIKRNHVELKDDISLIDASIDIDFLYAVHMKATAPIVDILYGNIYLGWDRAKISTTASNYANSSSWDSSLSYGVG